LLKLNLITYVPLGQIEIQRYFIEIKYTLPVHK